MRRVMLLIFMSMVMLLAACNGGEESPQLAEPSPDSGDNAVGEVSENTSGNTDTGNTSSGPNTVLVTPRPTNDPSVLEVPLPQTLVASETEDPEAALVFDEITFVRYSGPEGAERIEVKLLQDGSYTWNGTPGQTDAGTVTKIDDLLDQLNFFGLQGNMLGPSPETDDYRYSLTVIRGGNGRTINAQENFYPLEMNPLFAAILEIGFMTMPTPIPD